MIDPVTRAASTAPALRTTTDPAPASAAVLPATAPATDALARDARSADTRVPALKPLSVDVSKSDGVFVYTLSDPNTGAVVAIIPRADLGEGKGVSLDTRA